LKFVIKIKHAVEVFVLNCSRSKSESSDRHALIREYYNDNRKYVRILESDLSRDYMHEISNVTLLLH